METHKFNIPLGVKAKSVITGFTGVVTSRSEHINGCDRYFVCPPVNKDGTLPDGYWFDEQELSIINKAKKVKPQKHDENGGFHSKIK